MFSSLVALGAAAGLMFIAAPAHGAGDVVFGINDDNARGVLVQLLGSPDWASRPAAYAAAALRLVRAHPNIRELQVWNEPDLCWFPCAPEGDGFRFREGYATGTSTSSPLPTPRWPVPGQGARLRVFVPCRQTGLVRPDGSPKPAFSAFARAVG